MELLLSVKYLRNGLIQEGIQIQLHLVLLMNILCAGGWRECFKVFEQVANG
jgi:hypothetical protein